MKAVKKLGKWALYGFGGLVALIVVIAIATGGGSEETKSEVEKVEEKVETVPVNKEESKDEEVAVEEEEEVETAEETDQEVKETKDTTGVTMENFNKLETGMSYEEVVSILGSEGEILSESEIAGSKATMYTWDGDSGWGANMNVMIQDGELVSKAQFGLE